MGGFNFDLGISFDEFEDNMKKFMEELIEVPMQYFDNAVDTAVGFIEDIHERIYDPSPSDDADEAQDKANELFKGPPCDNVIIGSSATSETVACNEEMCSPSTSTVTVQDSFMVSTDARETESILTKCSESTSSEGGDIEVNDQCVLPMDTSEAEISEEEVLLCNSEKASESCTSEDIILLGRTVNVGKEVILWNPGKPAEPQSPESSGCGGAIIIGGTITNCEEQTESQSTKDPEPEESINHGVTVMHELTTDLSNSADESNTWFNDSIQFVDIDLKDDQERTEEDVSPVCQPKNTSFKKKLLKSLVNKLRWSKKERDVNQAAPDRSQEEVDVRYQAVSSSDDLDDDWELVNLHKAP
uniref:Uncharacterized protein n=1 Tax=Leersia perrieri TaxID=77586 RepID=A0A0D9UYB6_9ORYZ